MKLDNVYKCDCCTAQFTQKQESAGDVPAYFNVQTGTDELEVHFEHACPDCIEEAKKVLNGLVRDRRSIVGLDVADYKMPSMDRLPKDAREIAPRCLDCGTVVGFGVERCVTCTQKIALATSAV